MEVLNQLMMFGGALFIISILASTLSPRMGMPLLLVFLIIGMLAGEDGFLGIQFQNVKAAYFMGTLALAVILFDGGLRTEIHLFRVGLRPALSLATIGVVITVGVCGALAAWILGLSWVHGLLLGAIVGSTDAAAVFSVLTMQGLALKSRVGATLEIESGLNDPMAVFLTIMLVELMVTKQANFSWLMLGDFVWEMGAGSVVGIVGGRILAYAVERLQLSPGLYPLLALFGGVFIFGLAAVMHASGFLAVYLAGLMVGNRVSRGLFNIQRFHDGIAWLAQISLFLMLGLLVSPHRLVEYASSALLVGVLLMFVARPLAVWLCLLPFQFSWQEKTFISWVGLRGAVPIVLAMFPWLAGVPEWNFFFNIAFFIVLISLLVQGWTVGPIAKWLKLHVPTASSRVQRVELGVPGQVGHEFVGYKLADGSPALRRTVGNLNLPNKVQLVCLLREGQPVALSPEQKFQADDHIFFLSLPSELELLDKMLVGMQENERLSAQAFFGEFVLTSRAKLSDLSMVYNFPVPPEMANWSIARYILSKYRQPVVGDRVTLGQVEFVVLSMRNQRLLKVSLKLHK
ncbi:K(+)/H(+) antiporter NhaP2 [Cellvibrio zantedeschiae]|uniref:K(+)/H(+) antiporter NhaP2 n=1 Tax=Cellvibrio zantedeschiae TaxID=1237077 RepID=A0ABQ3AW45_9GAMM|nr:potassium/proton antiporter [Cellvibrio zantedeschiae]GGY67101.1 K(+)/H(+) antiporter NhaP2 [Cellvibrio zantedeschiae]